MKILLIDCDQNYLRALDTAKIAYKAIRNNEDWIKELYSGVYTHAILCSPLQERLAQIWLCIHNQVAVLAVNGLCTSDQLAEAYKLITFPGVIVDQPLIYSQDLAKLKAEFQDRHYDSFGATFECESEISTYDIQVAVINDLMLIKECCGNNIKITNVYSYRDDIVSAMQIYGTTAMGRFWLNERAYIPSEGVLSIKRINDFMLTPNIEMYHKMLLAFINNTANCGVSDYLELMEKVING